MNTRIILLLLCIILLILFGIQNYKKNSNIVVKSSTINSEIQSSKISDPILSKIQNMTLQEKIGQMFLIGSLANNSNEIMERLLNTMKVGSIVLLNPNINNSKVINITNHFRSISSKNSDIPLLISVDQEGGIVSRIRDPDSNLISQPQIKNPEQAYDVAFERGSELQKKGIEINFSPILEYITNPKSFLYSRVFRGSKENIIAYGEAMVNGYNDAGIISVIKHFPGHDNQSIDSHKDLPISQVDNSDFNEYTRAFREVIKRENPQMVMTAHVLFPKIDKTYPASLSSKLIGVLRNDYKYNGVIITDDMNMGAISKNFGIGTSTIKAIQAGSDIILYVATEEVILTSYNALINAVEDGQISNERINESVYRILKLKSYLTK